MDDVIPVIENDVSWMSNILARNINFRRQTTINRSWHDTGADGSAVGSLTRFQSGDCKNKLHCEILCTYTLRGR